MEKVQGWAEQGGISVVIPGTQGSGSQRFQQSFKGCTISVYVSGTLTLAPIYSDNILTSKANPFTASSTTGYWFFYAPDGVYDIKFSGGSITAPFTLGAVSLFDETSLVINVKAAPYLAKGDGVTDDSTAINAALAAATSGAVVWFPSGTYVIGSTLIPLTNTTIRGAGIDAVNLTVANGKTCFGVAVSDVNFSDFTITLTDSGLTSRGIQFNATVQDIYVDHVKFSAPGGPGTDCYALVMSDAFNLSNLYVTRSIFNGIGYVLLEGNSNVGTNKNLVFDNNQIINTASGINPNHPSATGATTDITITNNHFITMNASAAPTFTWGVGLSGVGVKRATVANNTFISSVHQMIHVEDSASEIVITGNRIYKKDTNIANVGLIHVISGAHAITINGNIIDLTDASSGSAGVGINIVAGGGSVPFDIAITGNTILTKALMTAIAAAEVINISITGNVFNNPSSASKATAFLNLTSCRGLTGGNNSFYNPAALVQLDNDAGFGVLTASRIDGNLTSFAFLTGNSNGSTSIVFEGFTIARTYVADNATNNVLFPAGTLFKGSLGMRFVQNGTAQTFVAVAGVSFDRTTFNVTDFFDYSAASGTATPNLLLTATNITSAAFNAGSVSGVIIVTFTGSYIP